jgi:PhnB protein
MFCTHIYFNGNCREAINLYAKALDADVLTVMAYPEEGKGNFVIHAEMEIDGKKLVMNDFGDDEGVTTPGGYQLVMQFPDAEQLRLAFEILSKDGKILSPMQSADYSSCVVRFADRFGTRWAFYV